MVKLKNDKEIEILRAGGKRLADILRQVCEHVAPGVRTADLDILAERLIREGGDKPAFKGYKPAGAKRAYPASLCVSVNEEIVHGIPSVRLLKEGDVVSLDLGLEHEGLFTDMAFTMPVGAITDKQTELLVTTRRALAIGVKVSAPGRHLGDVGYAIGSKIESAGFGLVRDLCGHGVGYQPHEDPFVPNFGDPGTGLVLKPGLVIAIEPMATLGSGEIRPEKDGYTYSTIDGSVAAHFEQTIAVTESGPEILTPFWNLPC
jgi:methionyl aminopeptidase